MICRFLSYIHFHYLCASQILSTMKKLIIISTISTIALIAIGIPLIKEFQTYGTTYTEGKTIPFSISIHDEDGNDLLKQNAKNPDNPKKDFEVFATKDGRTFKSKEVDYTEDESGTNLIFFINIANFGKLKKEKDSMDVVIKSHDFLGKEELNFIVRWTKENSKNNVDFTDVVLSYQGREYSIIASDIIIKK